MCANMPRASQAQVSVRTCEGNMLLEVCDNGIGFSPDALDNRLRYGLHGMRERSEMIGADFQIVSQPGQGTVISIRLPAHLKEQV
jgi:two-component system, NarL family, nitrate/nitrite sensor histidine kinase NarX